MDGVAAVCPDGQETSMLEKLVDDDLSHLHEFINKGPKFNDDTMSYELDFNGRVTKSSVKNFQRARRPLELAHHHAQKHDVFLLRKRSKERYK